jgi:3D (Asp-Asp-Asp) domain-containing protein/lysophospholipase L1-like esterase
LKKSGAASLVVVPLLLIVGFVLTILLLLQPPPSSACGAGSELGTGPTPGNLGGIGGTGITAAELATVRSSSLAAGNHFTEGIYQATSYGPPWGGIQGAGIATAAGLRINGGSPHKYFVATDPAVISSGQWLYVWPNPFNWQGPFLAADTGGAIDGRHIDIYDWRGRSFQLQWNRPVEVTRGPSSPLGPGPGDMSPGGGAPPLAPTTTTPAPAASGPVLNVGDSLAEGTGPELEQKLTGQTVTTLAARNRTSSQGLSILRGVATLPRTIVVQLGTNDSNVATFRANVRSVVALARAASATVWWVNISRPILGGTSASQLNDVLADEAARHSNLKIIDWNAAVASGTVDLADGVHPSAAGYKARAGLIADALGGAGGGGACGSAAAGSLGALTGSPESIVNGVVEYAHANGFPNVTIETVRVANAAHSVQTTSGNTSDHKGPPHFAWAADISNGTSPTTEMDALAAAIAGAFSIPWQGSGLVSAGNDEYRLQLIYRTCGGGDHWNHVHFGVKKVPGIRPAQTQPSTARPC